MEPTTVTSLEGSFSGVSLVLPSNSLQLQWNRGYKRTRSISAENLLHSLTRQLVIYLVNH